MNAFIYPGEISKKKPNFLVWSIAYARVYVLQCVACVPNTLQRVACVLYMCCICVAYVAVLCIVLQDSAVWHMHMYMPVICACSSILRLMYVYIYIHINMFTYIRLYMYVHAHALYMLIHPPLHVICTCSRILRLTISSNQLVLRHTALIQKRGYLLLL